MQRDGIGDRVVSSFLKSFLEISGTDRYQKHKTSRKQKSVSRICEKVEPRCKSLGCRDRPFGSNPKASVVLCEYSVGLIGKFPLYKARVWG